MDTGPDRGNTLVKVKLYIEGGGDSALLRSECRRGFRKLFERAGFAGRMPAIKASGGRTAAFDDFKTAMQARTQDELPVLLVDSEGPVSKEAWDHLKDRDKWSRPDDATDDQAQLMVQCMETWCVADRAALKKFFEPGLRDNALPPDRDLEHRGKDSVQDDLANATKDCGDRRAYRKGKRSFDMLATLDPETLRARLPHFRRLCETLEKYL